MPMDSVVLAPCHWSRKLTYALTLDQLAAMLHAANS